jgi:hypothetical protein
MQIHQRMGNTELNRTVAVVTESPLAVLQWRMIPATPPHPYSTSR